MTEESIKSVPGEIRPALSDLTNLPKKRGASSILRDDGGGSRVDFSKRLCVVVDDLVKQNGSSSDSKCSYESRDAMVEDVSSGDVKPLKEIYFEPGDRDGAIESACMNQTVLRSSSDAEIRKELGRSFELNRCSNVEKEEHLNLNVMGDDDDDDDDDLLKSCSCSFCLKAAYIWSDLHYQDIKGRLSALKKSQKVATNLIQRNGKEKSMDFHNSKLESDLMGQWSSLFLSMGDILAHESNHLQNSFMTMKDLREDCKIDLERATKTPQHNT